MWPSGSGETEGLRSGSTRPPAAVTPNHPGEDKLVAVGQLLVDPVGRRLAALGTR